MRQESEEVPIHRRMVRGIAPLQHLADDTHDWFIQKSGNTCFTFQNCVSSLSRQEIVCDAGLWILGCLEQKMILLRPQREIQESSQRCFPAAVLKKYDAVARVVVLSEI